MKRAEKSQAVIVVIEDDGWKKRLPRAAWRVRRAAALALPRGKRLTVLLTSDARLREMNHQFRGKDKPTNVLSFPAGESEKGYLGDVAIALGVSAREAKAEGKSLADHLSHLVIHGTLHLLGHDHEAAREAAKMESLEASLLAKIGIADPYREAA
ncbi:MAG TPA: rRNA maturation RNase YbeY [Rhizomicrobium sp.]|jgi:probable rRNA maturation factor|nr:rRNA maturation RNase YbeY [Rhizomicrobium sp.]